MDPSCEGTMGVGGIVKLRKEVPNTSILSSNIVPIKKLWDVGVGVDRALQMINKNNSPLIKVVLLNFHFLTSILL
ncbi:hypothetical protein HanOQP8_Chr04g0153511 [Helianthus annuus]|nr:hypothetical protein HanIR_Chr04g0186141 [Helianthus annuus]KAJ0761747.1 hypothetical protein HanOQP8_Chr04g0153511 [Helianthus annuus]